MKKESNHPEPSLLEAIVYDLKAEVRSLRAEVQQLTKNQVAVQDAEVRSSKAEVRQLIQEEIQKLTATNQNAVNDTKDQSQRVTSKAAANDNRDKSKEEIIAVKNNNKTSIDIIIAATIAATLLSNDKAKQSDNVTEERAAATSPNNNNNADADEKEDLRPYLFTNSTHKYLFMNTIKCSDDNIGYRVGLHHKVIATAIIVFQYFSYICFGYLIYRDYREGWEDRMTPQLHAVSPEFCYDTDAFPDEDPRWGHYYASYANGTYADLGQAINTSEALLLDWIKCNHANDDLSSEQYQLFIPVIISGAFLLSAFLTPDLYESFLLITKCKGWTETMIGAVIVFKAILALSVACMTGYNVEYKGLTDTFLLYFGLLFIHDVDEKFGYLQEIIERTREKQKHFRTTLQFLFFWWFCNMFFVLFGTMLYGSFILGTSLDYFFYIFVRIFSAILVFAAVHFVFAFVTISLAKCRFKREDAAAARVAATIRTSAITS